MSAAASASSSSSRVLAAQDGLTAGPTPGLALGPVVGEAAFLACSWTWCIGMFLPALLLRDMGVWAFVAFLVPNCLGAGLLAWWMRDPARHASFIAAHRPMMRVFSLVTIAFQCAFIAWMARGMGGLSANALLVIAALLAAHVMLPRSLAQDGSRRALSLGVLLCSLVVLVVWGIMSGSIEHATELPPPARDTSTHLPALLAVCVLGFFASPLLDGTFHFSLARARLDGGLGAGKAAFALGFGIFFPLVLLGSLVYGAALVRDGASANLALAPGALAWVVLMHVALQLGFTIGVHERWVTSQGSGYNLTLAVSIGGLLLGAFAPSLVPAILKPLHLSPDILPHEVVYRAFLAFFGLGAPLYVLGCVLTRAQGCCLTRAAVLAAGAVTALPFYWQGFIDRNTPALWWGVLVVVIAGLIAGRLPLRGRSAQA